MHQLLISGSKSSPSELTDDRSFSLKAGGSPTEAISRCIWDTGSAALNSSLLDDQMGIEVNRILNL